MIDFAGLSLELLPSGAVWNPMQEVLWVADVHLGKASSYRRLGQPVPQGTTTQTLDQLSNDLQTRPSKQLIVLGDFLHGPLVHQSVSTLAAIDHWRAQHRHLKITLIRGNHDDRAGDPPAGLGIEVVDEPFMFEAIACCHHDEGAGTALAAFNARFTMSGHLHPVVTLQGRARERLRLACFVVGQKRLVLPAYGAFTGGHPYSPASDERLYVIADQAVFRLPGPT